MTDWTIRYDEQGDSVAAKAGTGPWVTFGVVGKDALSEWEEEAEWHLSDDEVQSLIRTVRADRDREWLAWIEEERQAYEFSVGWTLDEVRAVRVLLDRLRARVDGK